MDACFIANQQIRAEFVELGAELRRFQPIQGPDLLWSGDPEVWGRVSPVLFPIVGQLKGDVLRHGGKASPMGRHGFARDRAFKLMRLSREACTWMLRDDGESREQFPFPFERWITYSVEGPVLKAVYEVRNPGKEALPASLGAHPAFRWPLAGGQREAHRLVFAKPESAPISRVSQGLLDAHPYPNPVDGTVLKLRDYLFTQDALIFDQLKSRSLRYVAPGALGIEFSWRASSNWASGPSRAATSCALNPGRAWPALRISTANSHPSPGSSPWNQEAAASSAGALGFSPSTADLRTQGLLKRSKEPKGREAGGKNPSHESVSIR